MFGAILSGATCVTATEQQGSGGPWIGEVVNSGTEPMNNITVEAKITDATGRWFRREYGNSVSGGVCPFTLRAGQRGWFQIFFQKGPQEPEPVLPLHAEFPPVASGFDAPILVDQGISVRLISEDRLRNLVQIEVRNDSMRTYGSISICGVLRVDGDVTKIGRADGPPSPALLLPGEVMSVAMYFNTLPEGSIEFFPIGYDRTPPAPCCMP
jgi:hypothetical protein